VLFDSKPWNRLQKGLDISASAPNLLLFPGAHVCDLGCLSSSSSLRFRETLKLPKDSAVWLHRRFSCSI
jgi:hypothetical protein